MSDSIVDESKDVCYLPSEESQRRSKRERERESKIWRTGACVLAYAGEVIRIECMRFEFAHVC